jgi:pyruvate formate lyase activating enzyme
MFKGIQKVSLIDFPGAVCTTLFTGGCNFRCPWCHNWELVEPNSVKSMAELPEDDLRQFLLQRKGKVEGVCVTGGEPTLWGDKLAEFMSWCRENGFLVKLDTNGYLPHVLEKYVEANLLNFIAMDIKNIFGRYPRTVDIDDLDITRIKRSIEVIRKSGVKHQFRTTVVPGLVIQDEVKHFFSYLKEEIVFQEYREPEPILGRGPQTENGREIGEQKHSEDVPAQDKSEHHQK